MPVVLIVLGHIYFNGFTQLSVFEGGNINDHPYYKEAYAIIKVSKDNEVVIFRKLDTIYYPNLAMNAYYKNKFGRISWIYEWSNKEFLLMKVEDFMNEQKMGMVEEKASRSLENKFNFIKLDESVYMIQKEPTPTLH